MDRKRLEEIKATAAKAREGQWFPVCMDKWLPDGTCVPGQEHYQIGQEDENPFATCDTWEETEFICASRDDVPELCEALETAWARIEELESEAAYFKKACESWLDKQWEDQPGFEHLENMDGTPYVFRPGIPGMMTTRVYRIKPRPKDWRPEDIEKETPCES